MAFDPLPLPVSGTIAIYASFFYTYDIYDIYMFWKPENSETENGI